MTRAVDVASRELPPNTALGVRNLIINGDMRIDQRGNLPLTNSTDEGDIWLVDRFKSRMFYATGAVDMSYEQRSDGLIKLTSNFNADMASGSNNWFRVMTALEQREANYVAGKTITVSFDFESNISGNFSVGITLGTGAGAATNKDYASLFSYTTGAVQRITKTITIPDSVPQNGGLNDVGLLLYLAGVADTTYGQYVITPDTWGNTNGWVATGTTNWIQSGNWIALGNVQLEVGEEATEFEHRPYDMELARCQRYYEILNLRSYGFWTGASELRIFPAYKAQKRSNYGVRLLTTTPYAEYPNVAGVTGSGSTIVSAATNMLDGGDIRVNGFSGRSLGQPAFLNYNTLEIDAEL